MWYNERTSDDCRNNTKTSRYNAIAIVLVMVSQMLLMTIITVFNIDGSIIMQFEFETILRDMAVIRQIEIKTVNRVD
ncbi:MAG: hypothetical protein ACLRQF_00160 [Thomasclavelia ramosa]